MNYVEESIPSVDRASSSTSGQNNPPKLLVHDALEANKRLQKILAQRAEQLEAKLKEVDQLLTAATVEESQDEPESEISIPGAKKATGLIPSAEFLSPGSPFYEEATKRSNYMNNITPHSLKAKDIEVLATAVRHENERLRAYENSRLQNNTADATIYLQNNMEGLDWNRIAEKVSDASSVKRTAVDCRIAWIADKHPNVNHSEWSEDELKSLQTLVSQHTNDRETVDWVKVAERLGTHRTPIACMKQMLPRHRHSWTEEADEKLLHAVETCGHDNWQLVAKKVSEYVSGVQCHNRWQKTLNPTLRRGAWTDEEDERLRRTVSIYGTSWIQVATFIPGRTNDQCRERWMERVNTSSKSAWTPEEDKLLLDLVKERGNQWKSISLTLGNDKTGQSCRLRYEKFKRLEKNPQNNSLSSLTTAISNHGSSRPIGHVETSAQDTPINSPSTVAPEVSSNPGIDNIISTVASSTSDLNGKGKNKVAEEPSQATVSSQGDHSGTASDINVTVGRIDPIGNNDMGPIPVASGSALPKDSKSKPRPRPRPKRPTKGASSDLPAPTITPENNIDLNTSPGTSGTPETQETALIPPLGGTKISTGVKRTAPEVPDSVEASKAKRNKRSKTINDSSNTESQQDSLQPKGRGRHRKYESSHSTELDQPVMPTGGTDVPVAPIRRQSSRLLASGKQ